MSTHTTVPSDVEAESMIDLVHDCREISGVLGSFVPTIVRIPEARGAAPSDARGAAPSDARGAAPSDARGAMPVEISSDVVQVLAGYDDYGS